VNQGAVLGPWFIRNKNMDNKKFWFFGSKLNTALLFILIILMIVALRWMYQDRQKYIKIFNDDMTSKEAKYWDNLTVKNPKSNEILGYDGKSLSYSIEGKKDNLISFSIKPGQEVSGVVKATGILSGGYFFEGNLPVSILDESKKLTSYGPGHGQATTDWMTSGPVSFSIDFDFSPIPKGNYYIRLMQDDPSGGENGFVPSFVLIPIIVK
jgi:hypothetical protein